VRDPRLPLRRRHGHHPKGRLSWHGRRGSGEIIEFYPGSEQYAFTFGGACLAFVTSASLTCP
jgi:hypothetical protein